MIPERLALLELADYVVTPAELPAAFTSGAAAAAADGTVAELGTPKTAEAVTSGLIALLQAHAPRAQWGVTTLGAEGCVAVVRPADSREQWEVISVPAIAVSAVEMVDTTGAGDAFIGGLAVGLVRGLGLQAALAQACWVGGHSVSGRGARGGLPTAAMLARRLLVAGD